jgi:NCS2 family nucleobase:cation symporter-2
MPVKPANIIYDVGEKPPGWITFVLGIQHVSLIAITFIFPVVIVLEMGGTRDQAAYLVSMSMMAGGVGTILQGLRRGPVGSGYLCPQLCGPAFLSASILAAKTGGLSLVMGLLVIAGLAESLISRVLHRLRILFPPEVTGLIVAMIGLTVIKLAVSRFFGVDAQAGAVDWRNLTVALLTLTTMIGLNVWSRGKLKLFCVLLGMVVGYLSAWGLGILGRSDFQQIASASWLSLPFVRHPGWSFDAALILPILVATLCSTLKSVGDITTCQKINDDEWKRPDMANIRKGILADGLGCLTAGLIGGVGQSTSSSNVGLSLATGVTSRVVAWVTGAILIGLAFFPKLSSIFAVMPKPVMGATLIFSLSFMFVTGMQMVMSRLLDGRKIFVVGVSTIFGLSVDMLPGLYTGFPDWIHPVFSSSLSATAVLAVVLNLVFRLGVASKVSRDFALPADNARDLVRFLEKQGGAWGARREVIERAAGASTELWEALTENGLIDGPLSLAAGFDEFNLDLEFNYVGRPMNFPDAPPDRDALLSDPAGHANLAGYLMRRLVDRIVVEDKGDRHRIRLHFEH